MRRLLIPAITVLLVLGTVPAAAQGEFHIVAGQPADEGEYPAQAALLQGDFQFCGGTLVDPQWVLTAAHCVTDGNRPTISPGDLTIVVNTIRHASGGERLSAEAIVSHPDYDAFALVNDIALVRLASPAATPPAVVVTAEGQALYQAGSTVTATGYGTTSFGGNPSDVLLEVDLPLVGDPECAASYSNLVNDRHTCAGGTGSEAQPGGDSCQGDSGGPLWTRDGEVLTLIGVTSFGNGCGFEDPGVYTEVRTYLAWVGGIIDGSIPINGGEDPTSGDLPTGSAIPPERIAGGAEGATEAVTQAIAVSQVAFREGGAGLAVIATSAQFPDALGGSSLAYGVGPLLFTGPDGAISPSVLTELRRAVLPASPVYVLGGPAAIQTSVDDALSAAGFTPTRVFGSGREATSVAIADTIINEFGGELPLDTVVVATGSNWPDAVAVGQIGSWWGVPILLTPTSTTLNPDTAAFLQRVRPSRVLVPGGIAAVTAEAVAQIEGITGPGTVRRLAGATRFSTAASITSFNTTELFSTFAPEMVVGVNLRREPDGFTHVLSASMMTGAFAGVMAPVEGSSGDRVPAEVLDSICGLDARVVIAGDIDLISTDVAGQIAGASGGEGCSATTSIDIGDVTRSAVTANLPVRSFEFQAAAGQAVQIRVDAPGLGIGEDSLDPTVELFGPDGTSLGENDDNSEAGLNSRLVATLAQTGTYRIDVSRFGDTLGDFALALDPHPPLATVDDGVSEAAPTDTYRVTGPAGARVIVEMRALQVGVDPVLTARTPDGTEVAFDDDGMTFPNARLSFAMPAGGAVDVVASTFFDSYGPYRLNIIDPSGLLAVG